MLQNLKEIHDSCRRILATTLCCLSVVSQAQTNFPVETLDFGFVGASNSEAYKLRLGDAVVRSVADGSGDKVWISLDFYAPENLGFYSIDSTYSDILASKDQELTASNAKTSNQSSIHVMPDQRYVLRILVDKSDLDRLRSLNAGSIGTVNDLKIYDVLLYSPSMISKYSWAEISDFKVVTEKSDLYLECYDGWYSSKRADLGGFSAVQAFSIPDENALAVDVYPIPVGLVTADTPVSLRQSMQFRQSDEGFVNSSCLVIPLFNTVMRPFKSIKTVSPSTTVPYDKSWCLCTLCVCVAFDSASSDPPAPKMMVGYIVRGDIKKTETTKRLGNITKGFESPSPAVFLAQVQNLNSKNLVDYINLLILKGNFDAYARSGIPLDYLTKERLYMFTTPPSIQGRYLNCDIAGVLSNTSAARSLFPFDVTYEVRQGSTLYKKTSRVSASGAYSAIASGLGNGTNYVVDVWSGSRGKPSRIYRTGSTIVGHAFERDFDFWNPGELVSCKTTVSSSGSVWWYEYTCDLSTMYAWPCFKVSNQYITDVAGSVSVKKPVDTSPISKRVDNYIYSGDAQQRLDRITYNGSEVRIGDLVRVDGSDWILTAIDAITNTVVSRDFTGNFTVTGKVSVSSMYWSDPVLPNGDVIGDFRLVNRSNGTLNTYPGTPSPVYCEQWSSSDETFHINQYRPIDEPVQSGFGYSEKLFNFPAPYEGSWKYKGKVSQTVNYVPVRVFYTNEFVRPIIDTRTSWGDPDPNDPGDIGTTISGDLVFGTWFGYIVGMEDYRYPSQWGGNAETRNDWYLGSDGYTHGGSPSSSDRFDSVLYPLGTVEFEKETVPELVEETYEYTFSSIVHQSGVAPSTITYNGNSYSVGDSFDAEQPFDYSNPGAVSSIDAPSSENTYWKGSFLLTFSPPSEATDSISKTPSTIFNNFVSSTAEVGLDPFVLLDTDTVITVKPADEYATVEETQVALPGTSPAVTDTNVRSLVDGAFKWLATEGFIFNGKKYKLEKQQ